MDLSCSKSQSRRPECCVCFFSVDFIRVCFLLSILMLSSILPAYQTAPTFPRFHSRNPRCVRAKAGHTGAASPKRQGRVCVCVCASVCLCEHENMKGRRGEGWRPSASTESVRDQKINKLQKIYRDGDNEVQNKKRKVGIRSDNAPKQTHKDQERARSWTDCNRTYCGKIKSEVQGRDRRMRREGH